MHICIDQPRKQNRPPQIFNSRFRKIPPQCIRRRNRQNPPRLKTPPRRLEESAHPSERPRPCLQNGNQDSSDATCRSTMKSIVFHRKSNHNPNCDPVVPVLDWIAYLSSRWTKSRTHAVRCIEFKRYKHRDIPDVLDHMSGQKRVETLPPTVPPIRVNATTRATRCGGVDSMMSVVKFVFHDACRNITSVIKPTALQRHQDPLGISATKVNGVRRTPPPEGVRCGPRADPPHVEPESRTAPRRPKLRQDRPFSRNGILAIMPVLARGRNRACADCR